MFDNDSIYQLKNALKRLYDKPSNIIVYRSNLIDIQSSLTTLFSSDLLNINDIFKIIRSSISKDIRDKFDARISMINNQLNDPSLSNIDKHRLVTDFINDILSTQNKNISLSQSKNISFFQRNNNQNISQISQNINRNKRKREESIFRQNQKKKRRTEDTNDTLISLINGIGSRKFTEPIAISNRSLNNLKKKKLELIEKKIDNDILIALNYRNEIHLRLNQKQYSLDTYEFIYRTINQKNVFIDLNDVALISNQLLRQDDSFNYIYQVKGIYDRSFREFFLCSSIVYYLRNQALIYLSPIDQVDKTINDLLFNVIQNHIQQLYVLIDENFNRSKSFSMKRLEQDFSLELQNVIQLSIHHPIEGTDPVEYIVYDKKTIIVACIVGKNPRDQNYKEKVSKKLKKESYIIIQVNIIGYILNNAQLISCLSFIESLIPDDFYTGSNSFYTTKFIYYGFNHSIIVYEKISKNAKTIKRIYIKLNSLILMIYYYLNMQGFFQGMIDDIQISIDNHFMRFNNAFIMQFVSYNHNVQYIGTLFDKNDNRKILNLNYIQIFNGVRLGSLMILHDLLKTMTFPVTLEYIENNKEEIRQRTQNAIDQRQNSSLAYSEYEFLYNEGFDEYTIMTELEKRVYIENTLNLEHDYNLKNGYNTEINIDPISIFQNQTGGVDTLVNTFEDTSIISDPFNDYFIQDINLTSNYLNSVNQDEINLELPIDNPISREFSFSFYDDQFDFNI